MLIPFGDDIDLFAPQEANRIRSCEIPIQIDSLTRDDGFELHPRNPRPAAPGIFGEIVAFATVPGVV